MAAFPPGSYPQPPSGDSSEKILMRLDSIETGIQKIETQQKEILAREDKILAELDRIRIWIRRQ